MESRVERTFAHLQQIFRKLLDSFSDGVTMHTLAAFEDAENELVQRLIELRGAGGQGFHGQLR